MYTCIHVMCTSSYVYVHIWVNDKIIVRIESCFALASWGVCKTFPIGNGPYLRMAWTWTSNFVRNSYVDFVSLLISNYLFFIDTCIRTTYKSRRRSLLAMQSWVRHVDEADLSPEPGFLPTTKTGDFAAWPKNSEVFASDGTSARVKIWFPLIIMPL